MTIKPTHTKIPTGPKIKFKSKIWLWEGKAAWHFASLPKAESAKIKTAFSEMKRGWGSFRVSVILGKTVWKTSIFPDNSKGTYLLPLKAAVRKSEKVEAGQTREFLVVMDL